MARRTKSIPSGIDWKALGYLTSIVSVLFLGAVAWQKENPPPWYYPALILGMVTSICGMAFRYKSHLDQQREIKKAEAKAERQQSPSQSLSSPRPLADRNPRHSGDNFKRREIAKAARP